MGCVVSSVVEERFLRGVRNEFVGCVGRVEALSFVWRCREARCGQRGAGNAVACCNCGSRRVRVEVEKN